MQGVSLSTASSINVQGVSLSFTSNMEVQGVSFPLTAVSVESASVGGVEKDAHAVHVQTTGSEKFKSEIYLARP